MDEVEAMLPYRNATKTFLSIFELQKVFAWQISNGIKKKHKKQEMEMEIEAEGYARKHSLSLYCH
jgi:hypothetical protein